MASLKTMGTFAIIIGCFAIIYPRFMHPIVLRAFGMHTNPTKDDESPFPPHMRHGGPSLADRKPPPMPHDAKDIRQHIRPGPHPGMRAAAEMQKQQSQGTGRGMMGIVLPMYAIGICVYLVYTLFKVFNKRGKYADPISKRRYDNERDGRMDSLGFPHGFVGEGTGQDCGEGEVQHYLQRKKQERELEDLLGKMDDTKNVSEDEMRALQKRLEETEAQMTRILHAMQTMQTRVAEEGTTSKDGGVEDEAAGKGVETVGAGTTATTTAGSGEGQKISQDSQSRGSSPDTESYEYVKNSASATTDASPTSEMSSPSSFEQISQPMEEERHGEEGEGGTAGGEDILLDGQGKERELDSTVRHRKTGHPEEDCQE